ncbi:MAG TPA: COX15/CtaA family protein [Acidimicrobiales bacterium]|nr:COX15/CtaA family protein [Acidimicrobiales bacterium]
MARRLVSPDAYRRVTLFAVVALGFIMVTGGAVRLTGSGLGCPDWPNCEQGRLVAPLELHPMVEFVNRCITGLVSVAVVLAVLGSLRRRPRRPDLVVLSLGLVAGVVAQIVLGKFTVKYHLDPKFVMAHFLLSIAMLADAVVLHFRAGQPDPGPWPPVVAGEVRFLAGLITAATALVVFLGTIVTGAGPHGGDENARRLDIGLHRAAQIHGLAVVLLLSLAVTTLAVLWRSGAPAGVFRRGSALLAVMVAQAAVGYTQYFTGVPVLLVGVHIAGAATVWSAALWFQLGMRRPDPVEAVEPGAVAASSPSLVAT